MRATTAEREREVEAAILLRQGEIERLEIRKEELQSQLVVSNPVLREDPLLSSFPILDYCGKKAKYPIKSVPLEQVGNVLSQFDIAAKAIKLQNKEDQVTVSELRRRIREQEKKYTQWHAKKQALASESGIDTKFITPQSREASVNMQNYTAEASIEEIEARTKIVQKEIRAGKVIVGKKAAAILQLSKLVEERKGIIDQIDELYNRIRIAERDTTIEEERFNELNEDNEDVEFCLSEKKIPSESPSRALIEQDVLAIKAEKEETVNEQRIPQERVVKAQDYRLSQLERRLKAVDKALKHNKLKREVDNIVANSWSNNAIEVPDSQEELYDIEAIIPAQEQVHPGIYNLLLTEKEKTARNVSVLNIGAKEKEEAIVALQCKLDVLAQECNGAIQQLDELASGAAFAEENERVEALQWIQEQRAYYNDLYSEKQELKKESRRMQ